VAVEGDIGEMIAIQVACMSDAIVDEDKHCQLQQCLMNHIFEKVRLIT